jgi:suppressor for copper-sensitivity B
VTRRTAHGPAVHRSTLLTASALLAAAVLVAALAPAASGFEVEERGRLEAGLDRTAYAPGETARLAAVLTLEEGWHTNAHVPTYDYLIPTEVTVDVPAGWPAPTYDYPPSRSVAFAFADEPLDVYDGRVPVIAELAVPAAQAAGSVELPVSFLYQACDDESCLPPVTATAVLTLSVGDGGTAQNGALFAPPGDAAGDGHGAAGVAFPGWGALGVMLLLGLVGGLILNVMPCVLPVLSLKVFGLVKSAGVGRAQVVTGALATSAGILASFWALAGFAVAARAAGAAVGWGVQFQRPGFVTFLAVVVVLFCLNLWGLFEIQLPGRFANTLGGGPREGVAGHFASGLFATLMATPCSAPFLGTAVGFALAQPAAVIFAVFTAVGTGMALPYLALAVAPGAARWLPKPGAWMETVRKVMGFLLAAAAVWLFYVLSSQVPAERLAAIELALLALALFVWLRHQAGGGAGLRRTAAVGMLLAVLASLGLAVSGAGAATDGATAAGGETTGLIPWREFDRAEAEELAASGRLVFVDVTADWCFTCKANERLVLETEETAQLFADHEVVAMKADWTNRDDDIAAFLAEHGKYSIPFYLLYRPGREPHPFSELLTRGLLRDAVTEAAQTASLQ